MAFWKKPSGRYVIDWRERQSDGSLKQRRKTLGPQYTTDDQAIAAWDLHAHPGEQEEEEIPRGGRVSDIWPAYMRMHAQLHLKNRTVNDMESVWGHQLNPKLGSWPLQDLSSRHLVHYQTMRKEEGVSHRTINKEVSYFNGFLTWCREQGIFTRDLKVRQLPYKRPKPMPLSLYEVCSILLNVNDRDRALIACYYLLGLRYDTVRRLTWEDVNFAAGLIYLRSLKSGEDEILPIPEWTLEALKAIRPDPARGFIFLNPLTGKSIQNVRWVMERARKAAGIDRHINPHLFRHSMATHLLDLRVNLRVIQEALTHKTIEATRIYTHVSSAAIKSAQDALMASLKALQTPSQHPSPRTGKDPRGGVNKKKKIPQ